MKGEVSAYMRKGANVSRTFLFTDDFSEFFLTMWQATIGLRSQENTTRS
jgi:hypothetical protein